ncbi:alpha/beta hydrolase family protein, partial [Mariniphaga sp.]|uniref:alpha/beta hydrolase family protein n=1 Tax=Mariniphaga sp. TaxID=1954475 RepID=UPI0035677CFE
NNNGVILQGKFYKTYKKGKLPTILLSSGLPGNEDDELGICKKLQESGINAMMFNYSGTHNSQGDWSWDNTQEDIQAALNFLYQKESISKFNIDTTCIILGGYSYGGGMALSYAVNHSKIQNVFSIAGTDHGAFMKEYIRNSELKAGFDNWFASITAPGGPVRVSSGASPKEIAAKGIDQLNPAYSLIESAPLLASKNILLIGGWDDLSNSIERTLPLYRALKNQNAQNIAIIAFQDDHSFKNSREDLANVIISWVKTVHK